MTKKVLEWQAAAILMIVIIIGGYYAYDLLRNGRDKPIAETRTGGELTAVTKLIVAEQTQTYSRFVDTAVKNRLYRALTLNMIKGKLYFQWEARNTYGIDVKVGQPITWKRTPGKPGEIEIVAPRLQLLSSKILFEAGKYKVLDIDRELGIGEEKFKQDYLQVIEADSKDAAEEVLKDSKLAEIAIAIVGDHVKNLLNQGLSSDKIHTAVVTFRS